MNQQTEAPSTEVRARVAQEPNHPGATRSLNEDRLSLALAAGQMGVWDRDMCSNKTSWNPQMYQLLGLSPDGTRPSRETFMALVHPDDRPGLEHNLKHAVETTLDFHTEFRIKRADTGQERVIAGRGRVICDSSGQPTTIMGVNFDITQASVNQAKVNAAERRRAEFLAMLGHELRNPLAPLAYVARKLETKAQDEALSAEAAQVIKRQVAQLTRLVDDLLEVSRIELGKIDLQLEWLSTEDVIGSAVDTVRADVQARDQRIIIDAPDSALIQGDRVRLIQVLVNLLNNASKYTQAGGVITMAMAHDEQHVHFKVTDNGPGIDAAMLPLLFDPFVQGSNTLDRSQDGLGIGLSVVKRLVDLHQGSVSVTTSPQGTSFTVTLPVQASPARSEQLPPATGGTTSRLSFLVVEDNMDAAALLADLLREEGHQVALAHDGVQALRMAHELRPDVILMDIGLPLLDGWKVAKALRGEPAQAGTIMVAMSGYGQPADRERSLEAGFDMHLTKPANLGELFRFIDETLSARHAQP